LFHGGNMLSVMGRRADSGFTLLEVMFASIIMAIVFMGLLASLSGSFLTTGMAERTSESQATAKRLLEEACELAYADMLLLDGNAIVTPQGLAAKYQVFETSSGLLTLEVEVLRPRNAVSVAALSAMSMSDFCKLQTIDGSHVGFTTLSTGLMSRASVTYKKQ
jgi:prepilin-type N-terminal cleavage/methylation domain-containing protein